MTDRDIYLIVMVGLAVVMTGAGLLMHLVCKTMKKDDDV